VNAPAYITVVETGPFIEDARRCLKEDEREAFIGYIARNPTAGVVIPGTGGVRKVRWRASGRGKRGGARVIYYYHSERIPLFLLTAYSKSRQTDLTPGQRTAMRRITAEILSQYTAMPSRHRSRKLHE
jgi:mRNA-degrading endonuclease RelE of RelBE toxin-antitoxin system